MKKNDIKKKKIFEIYAQNLKWIKDKTKAKFNIEFEYGILCPLCLNVFLENDLIASEANHLTLEHNPPKSLGGKDNILTCKECNNANGHKTDLELLNYLLEKEFKNFSPNSHHRTKLETKNGGKVTADLSVDKDGQITLNLQPKYSNPTDYKKFIDSEETGFFAIKGENNKFATKRFKFEMPIPAKGNMRLASISLLKIGYLLGFEKYGHIFLFNKNIEKIRQQILNPEKEILTEPFWINFVFPEMYVGVNIVSKPTELACFLNIFNLKTKSRNLQVSIAFPGYNDEDFIIYENIRKFLCSNEKGSLNMEITTLEPLIDLKSEEKVFSSAIIWDKKPSHNSGLAQLGF